MAPSTSPSVASGLVSRCILPIVLGPIEYTAGPRCRRRPVGGRPFGDYIDLSLSLSARTCTVATTGGRSTDDAIDGSSLKRFLANYNFREVHPLIAASSQWRHIAVMHTVVLWCSVYKKKTQLSNDTPSAFLFFLFVFSPYKIDRFLLALYFILELVCPSS